MTQTYLTCTWWCFLLHRALRLACRQRWPHLGSAGQFPPSAAQSHPPRRSRRFLTCRHGNHPNRPITKKAQVSGVWAGAFGAFVVMPIVSDKRPQHTVTSILMMSPSWRGRLEETECKRLGNWETYCLNMFQLSGSCCPLTCPVCRDRPRCSRRCTLISGSPRI